jgi:hypothetical protein
VEQHSIQVMVWGQSVQIPEANYNDAHRQ